TSNPSIPQGVAELVARLLEKDPARRPQTAGEVVSLIDSLLLRYSGNIPLPQSLDDRPTEKPLGAETIAPGHSATLPPTQAPTQQPPGAPSSRTIRAHRLYRWVAIALGLGIVVAAGFGLRGLLRTPKPGEREPIVVGVLHSRTGTMAVSEASVIDATYFA